ncbi:MAG: PilN domain-containing protein, partial [Bdellovibrionaceae bacterium]|nr:PilN domain-containing protein [Pseudobdellovibrionaceae bacterium]
MIKINFLTSFKEYAVSQGVQGVSYVDEDERKQILIEVAKRILIIAIGPVGLYIYEAQTIPVLKEKLATAEAEYIKSKAFNDSKQGLSEEIKKFEDESARFNAQMDFINKIQVDKVNEYKLFRLLQESTPKSVWINRLSFINNTLEISGESVDQADIGKFTQILSSTDFLSTPIPLGQNVKTNYSGSG